MVKHILMVPFSTFQTLLKEFQVNLGGIGKKSDDVKMGLRSRAVRLGEAVNPKRDATLEARPQHSRHLRHPRFAVPLYDALDSALHSKSAGTAPWHSHTPLFLRSLPIEHIRNDVIKKNVSVFFRIKQDRKSTRLNSSHGY